MIKNIIFDMGNVLFRYDPDKYVHSIITDSTVAERVLNELFRSDEWVELDRGSITEEEGLRAVIARAPQYERELRLAMEHWHESLAPVEGMESILESLKQKGYRLYLLSNTSMRFYDYYENYTIFNNFEGMLISAKELLIKPDPAIYTRFLDRMNLKAEECLFIDDQMPNIKSAEAVGIICHHFTTPSRLLEFFSQSNI